MPFDFRSLTLGATFQPRVKNISTPDLMTAKGAPDDLLCLVSMSATDRIALSTAMGADSAVNSALLVCKTLRYRDAPTTAVYEMTDAAALAAQDYDLLEVLAGIVKPFLGLGDVAAQVEAAKNVSAVTPSSDGGTDLPAVLDVPPSEPVSQS